MPDNWKVIIAPHEVHAQRLKSIRNLFRDDIVLMSELTEAPGRGSASILLVDSIGMLSRLYGYGTVAYVGGGFNRSGIHNVLEPAVFGLPVIFGPAYKKFVEAVELTNHGFAFPVTGLHEFSKVFTVLANNQEETAKLRQSLRSFVASRSGASTLILEFLARQHWL
jgi:3-deoxy-D-manno-octulosonic-acid transferase